jgi:cytochrome c-type biogenesis protein CcmH/NrfG
VAGVDASKVNERIVDARTALDGHAWGQALALLRACDAERPLDAQDLDRLGEASMWAGHVDDCLAAWERA